MFLQSCMCTTLVFKLWRPSYCHIWSYCIFGFCHSHMPAKNFLQAELPFQIGLKLCLHITCRAVKHMALIMCADRAKSRGTIPRLHMRTSKWPLPIVLQRGSKRYLIFPFKLLGLKLTWCSTCFGSNSSIGSFHQQSVPCFLTSSIIWFMDGLTGKEKK